MEEIDLNYGCHLYGSFYIKKVPGDFHISSHNMMDNLPMLFMMLGKKFYDLSHHINHLSFGDDKNHHLIEKHFPDSKISYSLDNIEHYERVFDKKLEHEIFNYHITIVPTYFETMFSTFEQM